MASKITDIIDFNQNYYEILGISPDDLPIGKDPNSKRLSNSILQKAYREQLFKYHPDRPEGDEEKCKLVIKAHKILSDPVLRKVYDNGGENDENFIKQGMNINWDRLGKYRKGSLADMIGTSIFDKIINESGIDNIQVKFKPENEELHNLLTWEFIIKDYQKN
jgi:DnaJ-class molecular chaperone